jgi:hypothetical protein
MSVERVQSAGRVQGGCNVIRPASAALTPALLVMLRAACCWRCCMQLTAVRCCVPPGERGAVPGVGLGTGLRLSLILRG